MLTPNSSYIAYGVTVNEKIIPDGTRWQNGEKALKAGFYGGSLYKMERKLTNNTGKALSVTIHNTNDLLNVEDDGEQYTRATFNENMGSARVHFYVDDKCAWQNLKAGTGMIPADPVGEAEVSWHAGDGSVSDGGNMTSISIEIIMGDSAENDKKAYDNGARLAAWLLRKHGLKPENVVSHTYWVNKSEGKKFSDVDEQCTAMIYGKKWCPSYIFKSYDHNTALKNWKRFKDTVKHYYDSFDNSLHANDLIIEEIKDETIYAGDLVELSNDALYYNNQPIPAWVKTQKWFVKSISADRAVIDKNEGGSNSICSPVNVRYLKLVRRAIKEISSNFSRYLVKITTNDLNIRTGPGTDHSVSGHIVDRGVYTIVEESAGSGASLWGKLKSGAGWISLDYAKRVS